MFSAFYLGNFDVSQLKRAIICLIPKISEASKITNFRPISLLDCSYKIFTKVLANRFQHVLQCIISPNQSAFLKGRFNMDGIITAHKILYFVHLSKEQGVLLKLGFQKAFDSVNWGYIFKSLRDRGVFGAMDTVDH
jgi:Reverse transcriptase (RNA-dependent DNA polymerase)